MSPSPLRPINSARPLVAVVCSVSLLGEAMRSELEFAEVRAFTPGRDTAGLLRWLQPDVVIVDTDDDAREASVVAAERDFAVLHISVRDGSLQLFRDGVWEHLGKGDGPDAEDVRNVIAGSLFARAEREK
jgi:hypothetical protein